jgi:hypothetical protein
MCRVVNFKQYGSIEVLDETFGDRWTYIGRASRLAGLPQSPLANPFRVGDFGGRRGATLPFTAAGCGRRFRPAIRPSSRPCALLMTRPSWSAGVRPDPVTARWLRQPRPG